MIKYCDDEILNESWNMDELNNGDMMKLLVYNELVSKSDTE